jgi:hypothetical protein
MRWNTIILSLSISLTPITSYSAVYKWTDDQGNMHYTQEKPPATKAKRMKIAPPPKQSGSTYKRPSLKKKEAANNQNTEQSSDKNNKQTEEKVNAKDMAASCKSARSALKTLQSSGRTRLKDKDGNISYMTDEQKQKRVKQERDSIAKNCK